jgi:hypothetical protein
MAAGHWLFDSLTGSAFPIAIAARCTAPCRAATWCSMLHRVLQHVALCRDMLHVALCRNMVQHAAPRCARRQHLYNPDLTPLGRQPLGVEVGVMEVRYITAGTREHPTHRCRHRQLREAGRRARSAGRRHTWLCNMQRARRREIAIGRCSALHGATLYGMAGVHPHRPTRWPRVESVNTWTVAFVDVALTHACTHPLTHSHTHALTHSRTRTRMHSPTHALTNALTHPPKHSPTHYQNYTGPVWARMMGRMMCLRGSNVRQARTLAAGGADRADRTSHVSAPS